MAYYDTYNNVQFLDLSGVDEEEQKWILTSLQENHPCVEGPWSKDYEVISNMPTSQPESSMQTNLNNGMPPMSYERYPSSPVIISNHVSPISAQVFPQTYQPPIPLYPTQFVPQYSAHMMPVVPGNMMPVNAPMMSFTGQPVTYATYQPPIQASPIYNMPPVVKDSVPSMNAPQPYHRHPDHQPPMQQQEYCPPVVMPVPVHRLPQPAVVQTTRPITTQQSATLSNNNGSVGKTIQTNRKQQAHQVPQQPTPITANGPVNNPTPIEANKVSSTATNQIQPVVTNGHDAAPSNPAVQTNGLGSVAVSPTSAETQLSAHGEAQTSPSVASDNTAASEGGAGMSWASRLFKNKNNADAANRHEPKSLNNNVNTADTIKNVGTDAKSADAIEDNRKKSLLADINDPNYYRMGEVLVKYTPDNKITSLQPRGLINRSNYCYINSILQALLACPPMYNLLHALGANVTDDYRKHTHIIDNVVKFAKEFNLLPAAQRVNRRSDKVQKKEQNVVVSYDRPFEPNWIYKMLNGMQSDSFVVEGRQEDAEEFLGCLLNGLNDEMLELMKLVGADVDAPQPAIEDGYKSDSDREWQVIGPKNKGCITRRTEIVRTPISDIFGGHIRSKLHRAGDQITNNIQPFFTLQLNIEKANTVREALEALVTKNQLEGVTSSKTNEEVEAWQQVTIEELPVVLILHLKCFDFKMDGCTKIVKALEFPVDLKIDSKWLSQKANYQPKEKQYKLFAVVYHDGKEATKGHYLTDAYHVGYASWLRFDDSSVKTVHEEQVLKPHGTRVPYLLFYRRCDTVRNK